MRAVKLLGCGGVGFRRIVGEGPFDGCRVVVPGFRYLMEVVSHCVWLYRRFPLSFREVEEMMERGVVVSYETIRQRCGKVGQTYATGLRRHRPRPGDKWHLDEVPIKARGKARYLWRAVDQDGTVLDNPGHLRSGRPRGALSFLRVGPRRRATGPG